jgi:RNA polymerase sigma factor (TIGR02999 family)
MASSSDPPPQPGRVTQILTRWRDGDRAALNELIPVVHRELHRIAARYLRDQRPGHTLQSTALVNEAYLKLVDYHGVDWRNRAHFFAIAASIIRNILVDHARARNAQKRGGDAVKFQLDEMLGVPDRRDLELVALDDALLSLAALDAQHARLVELRFFAGLTNEETAEVLGLSESTVKRDWAVAKAWLFAQLSERHGGQSDLRDSNPHR